MLSWHFLSREIFNFAIFIAIFYLGVYVATKMPLGRWKISAKRFIATSPATIWAYADPRLGLAIVFRKEALVKDFAIISEEPLTAQYQVRMSPACEFESHRSVYTEIVAMKGYNECVVRSNGAEIAEKSRVYETLTIEEVEGGAMVRKTWSTPVTGLLGFEFWRRGIQRWLAGLDDALVAKPLKFVPIIRFPSWRLALLSLSGFLVMLAWGILSDPTYRYYLPLVTVGSIAGALFLHEFGHAIMFLAFGHRPVTLRVTPVGIGYGRESKPFKSEFEKGMISVGGVLLCSIIALALLPMLWMFHGRLSVAFELQKYAKSPGVVFFANPENVALTLASAALLAIASINAFLLVPFRDGDCAALLQVLFPTRHLRWLATLAVLCCFFGMLGLEIFGIVAPAAAFYAAASVVSLKRTSVPLENLEPSTPRQKLALGSLFVAVLAIYVVVGQSATFVIKSNRAQAMGDVKAH